MTAGRSFDPEPLAERVWREVGYRPKTPRDLVPPLMETFDIAVVIVPRLSIGSVNAWLSKRGRRADVRHRDRELRGCLLARRSHGLVFIDGSMSEDERQFAMAHEFGHFFAHYLEPRRRALARLGEAILPVLDGERSATTAERLSSILQGVPFGTFEDFLGRDGEGIRAEDVQAVETEADLLALELLAPRNEVEKILRPGSTRVAILCKEFGLPRWAAEKWDEYLNRSALRIDPLISSMMMAVKKSS